MPEKVCWTLHGRKVLFEVDEDNKVVREISDLGPLSEIEMKWVKANSGITYNEWLKKWEAGELDVNGKMPCCGQEEKEAAPDNQ